MLNPGVNVGRARRMNSIVKRLYRHMHKVLAFSSVLLLFGCSDSASRRGGHAREGPAPAVGVEEGTEKPNSTTDDPPQAKTMDEERFWQIIESACRSDPQSAEEWDSRLTASLAQLTAEEIVEWNHIFDQLAARAYRTDLWAAAYLINGGASDDGFYYFRCWLIGMGKQVYNAAIQDPDSLADVVTSEWPSRGIDAEAEIYAAAHEAWLQVTGRPDTADYPARNESAELVGDDWNFEDRELMHQHLPRLTAVFTE
jgi:hypothetical protein